MQTCEACCRECSGRRTDCSHCGFNTARHGGPRSKRSLATEARLRQDEAERQRELRELSEAEQRWWQGMEGFDGD